MTDQPDDPLDDACPRCANNLGACSCEQPARPTDAEVAEQMPAAIKSGSGVYVVSTDGVTPMPDQPDKCPACDRLTTEPSDYCSRPGHPDQPDRPTDEQLREWAEPMCNNGVVARTLAAECLRLRKELERYVAQWTEKNAECLRLRAEVKTVGDALTIITAEFTNRTVENERLRAEVADQKQTLLYVERKRAKRLAAADALRGYFDLDDGQRWCTPPLAKLCRTYDASRKKH